MQAANILRGSRTRRGLGLFVLLTIFAALLAIATAAWKNDDVSQSASEGTPRTIQTNGVHRFGDVLRTGQQQFDSPPSKVIVARAGNSRLAFSEALAGELGERVVAPHGVGLTESEPWTPPASVAGSVSNRTIVVCTNPNQLRACIRP